MALIHTEDCLKKQQEIKLAFEKFEKDHPHYCRKCEASGVIGYYESVDEYGGYWASDICEHCACLGNCPLCGEHVWDDETIENNVHLTCPKCGWDEDNPPYIPEFDYPCECEAKEMIKQEEEWHIWEDQNIRPDDFTWEE